jgi:hypothetical protein
MGGCVFDRGQKFRDCFTMPAFHIMLGRADEPFVVIASDSDATILFVPVPGIASSLRSSQ